MSFIEFRQQTNRAECKRRAAGVPALVAGFLCLSVRVLHGIEICLREPLNTTPVFGEAL